MIKQDPHHVVAVSGGLVSLHSLSVRPTAFLGLGVLLVQLRGRHLFHQRGRRLKIEILDVERCSLLKEPRHLVELGGFGELLHAFQTGGTILAQPLIPELLGDGDASSQISELDSRPCDPSLAEVVVGLCLLVVGFRQQSLLVVLQGHVLFPLGLQLHCRLQQDIREAIRGERPGQVQGLIPLHEIAIHVQSGLRLARRQEKGLGVFEQTEDKRDVPGEQLPIFNQAGPLQELNHARGRHLPIRLHSRSNVQALQGAAAQCHPDLPAVQRHGNLESRYEAIQRKVLQETLLLPVRWVTRDSEEVVVGFQPGSLC
mmetsp:Transcript_63076/g.169063  ORF Transcript_63076/g.169063 Transcript_63076/m.169063 type:complete len:314 (-) Transcript_63076:2010-2951(-)